MSIRLPVRGIFLSSTIGSNLNLITIVLNVEHVDQNLLQVKKQPNQTGCHMKGHK